MINLNEMSINLKVIKFNTFIRLLQSTQIIEAKFPTNTGFASKNIEKCTEQCPVYETIMSIRYFLK
jgi:hypothetical protein